MDFHVEKVAEGDPLWLLVCEHFPRSVEWLHNPNDDGDYHFFLAVAPQGAFLGGAVIDIGPIGFGPLAGRIEGWTCGGYVVSVEWASVPSGVKTDYPGTTPDYLHKFTFEVADYSTWFEWEICGQADIPITVVAYVQAQQTGMTERMTLKICDPQVDFEEVAEALDSDTAPDDTSWHTLTCTYTPTYDQRLQIRLSAKNASGTAYCYLIAQVPPAIPAQADTRYGVARGYPGDGDGLLEIPNSGTPTGTQDATSDACVVIGKKYGSPQRTGTGAGGGYTYGDEDEDKVPTNCTGSGTYVLVATNDALHKGIGYFGAGGALDGNYYSPSSQDGVTTTTTYGVSNATSGTLNMALYCLIAGITWPELDEVDGGVQFGPVTGIEYEGTGVNSTTLASALTTLKSDLATAHGAGSWLTATGFATPTNVTDAVAAIESHGDSNWGAVLSEEQITDIAEAAAEEVGTLTAQEVRDAMKLAPTAGSPAAGSVDKHLDDIQTKTDNIGTATIVVSTPLSVDGSTLYLTRGDSYTATAGRAIEFTYSGSADIAGATATLSVRTYDDSLEMTVKGTIDGDTITFEPTATDTADLTETHLPRKHKYDYELVLADGTTHITPVVGNCIVTMDKSR